MGLLCKVCGAVLVLTSTSYFALSMNQTLEMRKQELRKLYSILLQLKGEIQYMYNPLPESFTKLAKSTKAPFSDWLQGIVIKLEEKNGSSFAKVWEEELEQLFHSSCLEKDDIEPLRELADKLGTEDITTQLKAIDYVLLHIEKNRTSLEEEMGQKKKVTVTLSLFCGAMTLILLL